MGTKIPIRRPGDIDARWLTDVLQANEIDAVVAGCTKKNVGTGQIGDSVRFTLDYERDAENAPRSLVGKFPSPDDTSRGTGIALGNYHREVRFYQHLAHKALIHTPKCYFTDIDEGTHEFALIMEDLAPAEQGDQLKGVTLDQARLAVTEAAKLHASHWADDSLDQLDWVSGSAAARAKGGGPPGEMVVALWKGFKARYGARLEPDSEAIGERLCTQFAAQEALHPGPRCLTHNDYRPDNMMFATPAGGYPFTMLDWQSFAYGTGAVDVAYFLAGAISPELRRTHEDSLLRLYHETLAAHGVRGYSFEDLRHDYRSGAFLLFFTAFFASMVVVQTPRGDDMFFQMIRGASEHIKDHDALALLPS